MQLHKFIMTKLLVPDFRPEQRRRLLRVFDKFLSTHFPSLAEQFASLTPETSVDPSLRARIVANFGDDFRQVLGKGFPARSIIDNAILNALGWKEEAIKATLKTLYPSLLKEILILHEIMVGKDITDEEI